MKISTKIYGSFRLMLTLCLLSLERSIISIKLLRNSIRT